MTDAEREEGLAPADGDPAEPGGPPLPGSPGMDLMIEVAHDLRSPLTSIMFLAETLRAGHSGPINSTQRQQLGIIYSAALGLHSLANDLMELAREGRDGETGQRPEPAAERFSLAALFDSVRSLVRPMLEEKGLRLSFELPRADLRVGKVIPLSRTLLNLLTNAIKFTPEGEIEVLARERGSDRVEFSVRDSGRGMEPETLETLYDTFQRGDTETGYRFSETGLGLSICRRMVRAMGGELAVETEPGKGTRFRFEVELPVVSDGREPSEEEQGAGRGGPGAERQQSLE